MCGHVCALCFADSCEIRSHHDHEWITESDTADSENCQWQTETQIAQARRQGSRGRRRWRVAVWPGTSFGATGDRAGPTRLSASRTFICVHIEILVPRTWRM